MTPHVPTERGNEESVVIPPGGYRLLFDYWPHVGWFALVDALVIGLFIPWVLTTKKDTTAAMAWCLVVLFMPLLGAFLFWVFGYVHVHRPLRRKRLHRESYEERHPPRTHEATRGEDRQVSRPQELTWSDLGQLALEVDAFPVSHGNAVTLYADTAQAFDTLLTEVRDARHHVHLEYFIFQPDATGRHLLDLLTQKAKAGIEVRLLFDSMGSRRLPWRLLRPLLAAGGRVSAFLPLNPLRSRIQVNLRNHRKLTVIDGRIGFVGGMNIGDEYLGKDPRFGYWRDEFLRLEGPAVSGLQRIFDEDWHFAHGEALDGPAYFPELPNVGDAVVQVIESGPDQETNSIREMYFAAILSARERIWLSTPYFVPDSGLMDALRLARYRGVDVRMISQLKPDHYLAYHASRYNYRDLLDLGVKVYLYRKGVMHAKLMMIDGRWALVGSANFDNRSLHLNFEAGCILHSSRLVAELDETFRRDLADSSLLDSATFAQRPFLARLAENACRLLSPIL